jgi:hypothetical protein
MTKIDLRQVVAFPGCVPLWSLEYTDCLSRAAFLCRLRSVRCHVGVSARPFTDEEFRRAYGFVCLFAPDLDVGFVVAGHDLGKSWLGRPKRAFGVYVSLPVTGKLERIGIVKTAEDAVTIGARWLAEAQVSLEEVARKFEQPKNTEPEACG